jgi:osmotically-inducible protein OsmY
VIASMEYRIKAAMEKENLNRKAAISMIKKLEKQSLNWTRFLYGVEWHDSALYDAVINLDRMSIESAVDIIARMIELDDFRPDENSKVALNNQVLSSMVWAALTKDDKTNNSNIHVFSDNGTVKISGSTGSEDSLRAIEEIIKGIEGVKEVINEVEVGADRPW